MASCYFPQLSSGITAQYPIRRERKLRAVTNVLPDGRLILFEDPDGSTLHWTLEYTGLSSSDITLLRAHFEACAGPLLPFTFFDPTDNLLSWSSDLTKSVWERSGDLKVQTTVLDPLGCNNAFTLVNDGQDTQDFQQRVTVPAAYLQCFSLYVKSVSPGSLQMLRSAQSSQDQTTVPVSPSWSRVTSFGSLSDASPEVLVGIRLKPGQQLDIFGPHLELQASPSPYLSTSDVSGIHTNAFLKDQHFIVTARAPNSYSLTMNVEVKA